MTIAYELPEPAIMLIPDIRNTLLTCGIVREILSTLLAIIVERSSEDAGERLILTKIVPISSSGTKPDGVVFIRRKSPPLNSTTAHITIHFFEDKSVT
jgi:hypothetical protein